MNDTEILRLLEQRQEEALSALSREYGAYCREIALRLTGQLEEAEEVVNDLLLRVWESIPPQRPQSLRHYLAKLTRNLAYDRFRNRSAAKRGGGELEVLLGELENCLPAGETPESLLSAKELGAAINRFLDTQPSRTQSVFLRRYFYGETVPEIAKRYGMREDNVRLTLSRTRAKLKAYLEKGGYL